MSTAAPSHVTAAARGPGFCWFKCILDELWTMPSSGYQVVIFVGYLEVSTSIAMAMREVWDFEWQLAVEWCGLVALCRWSRWHHPAFPSGGWNHGVAGWKNRNHTKRWPKKRWHLEMLTQELWCWLDLWILCEFLFFGRPGCVGYFLTHAETPGVHQSWKEQISTRRLRPGKVEVIGKVIGNFWQKSMDLQFIMFFEMDENFLFGCFGFFVDIFWRFLRKKDDLVTFRRFFKKRFLMSHFFPPKKKLCQAQRLRQIQRWLKLNFIHFQEGSPKGWFIVQVDPIGSMQRLRSGFFSWIFLGVGETQFGEVF